MALYSAAAKWVDRTNFWKQVFANIGLNFSTAMPLGTWNSWHDAFRRVGMRVKKDDRQFAALLHWAARQFAIAGK